ncbi:hypothetical protein [Pseudomonas mandelii]
MDYQVDHSSHVAVPSYASFAAASASSQPLDRKFYLTPGATNSIPAQQYWESPRSTSVDTKRIVRKVSDFKAVRVKKDVSPSTQDESKARFVSERLGYIYCNDAAAQIDTAQSRIALRGVVDAVEDLIGAGDYLTLDKLLAGVDPAQLRPITNVAFLRSSFQVKDKLSNWNPLYQVIYAHLANTGQNPARALRGLSASRVSNFA